VRGRSFTVRAIALLGAGSAAIHQLRYAIGYGDAAPHALAAHAHGYLEVAFPGVVTAALIALAGALMRAAGARGWADAAGGEADPHRARRRPGPRGDPDRARRREAGALAELGIRGSLPALWLACALALATIYGVQETLEGAGAVAGSGWIGLALAVPAGFLVALAMRGAHAAETLSSPQALLRALVMRAFVQAVRTSIAPRRLPDLRLGARAPPLASVV
jgi:hypothetical protein